MEITSAEPCACCGTCTPVAYECRIRGGVASLVGFEEFTSPATPPKKYRRRTVDGYRGVCDWSNSSGTICGAPNAFVARDGDRHAGFCQYDAATGALTNNLTRRYDLFTSGSCSMVEPTTLQAQPLCTAEPAPSAIEPNAAWWLKAPTVTKISKQWDGRVGCYATATTSRIEQGSYWSITLSDEDTEAAALARLLASATWSAWAFVLPETSCLAEWQARTSGFTFDYYEAEWRVQLTGLTPSTPYWLRVQYFRRPFGSGTFELFAQETIPTTSTGAGEINIDATVPNERGFETYAASVELCTVDPADLPS